jgi:hypothetical protein
MSMSKIKEATIDLSTGKVTEGPPIGPRILCMPMKKNVPNGRPSWEEVPCPKCGRPCWDRPVPEVYGGVTKMCTECANSTINAIAKNHG